MCPLLVPTFKASFLRWPLTVLMKQTRQAVCAFKESILLRCLRVLSIFPEMKTVIVENWIKLKIFLISWLIWPSEVSVGTLISGTFIFCSLFGNFFILYFALRNFLLQVFGSFFVDRSLKIFSLEFFGNCFHIQVFGNFFIFFGN